MGVSGHFSLWILFFSLELGAWGALFDFINFNSHAQEFSGAEVFARRISQAQKFSRAEVYTRGSFRARKFSRAEVFACGSF